MRGELVGIEFEVSLGVPGAVEQATVVFDEDFRAVPHLFDRLVLIAAVGVVEIRAVGVAQHVLVFLKRYPARFHEDPVLIRGLLAGLVQAAQVDQTVRRFRVRQEGPSPEVGILEVLPVLFAWEAEGKGVLLDVGEPGLAVVAHEDGALVALLAEPVDAYEAFLQPDILFPEILHLDHVEHLARAHAQEQACHGKAEQALLAHGEGGLQHMAGAIELKDRWRLERAFGPLRRLALVELAEIDVHPVHGVLVDETVLVLGIGGVVEEISDVVDVVAARALRPFQALEVNDQLLGRDLSQLDVYLAQLLEVTDQMRQVLLEGAVGLRAQARGTVLAAGGLLLASEENGDGVPEQGAVHGQLEVLAIDHHGFHHAFAWGGDLIEEREGGLGLLELFQCKNPLLALSAFQPGLLFLFLEHFFPERDGGLALSLQRRLDVLPFQFPREELARTLPPPAFVEDKIVARPLALILENGGGGEGFTLGFRCCNGPHLCSNSC